MRLTIEPTSKIVDVETDSGTVPARVWQGTTEFGVEVAVLVTRVATLKENDQREFEATLMPIAPGRVAREAFPMRMIL